MPTHNLDPEILRKIEEIDKRFHSPRGLKKMLIDLCLMMKEEGRKYCAAELRRLVAVLQRHDSSATKILTDDKRYQEICLDPDKKLLTSWRVASPPIRPGRKDGHELEPADS